MHVAFLIIGVCLQKFWVRAMLLVDDWKEMYQLKEQQLERLTEEHAQLRHEHQVGMHTTVGSPMQHRHSWHQVGMLSEAATLAHSVPLCCHWCEPVD